MQLELTQDPIAGRTISPFRELGAYEALWVNIKASFKTIAEKFAARPGALPSDFVEPSEAARYADAVHEKFHAAQIGSFGVRVHGAAEYPGRLRDAKYPVELLYYQGWWDLIDSRSVSRYTSVLTSSSIALFSALLRPSSRANTAFSSLFAETILFSTR